MHRNGGSPREVAVPVSIFTTLRKELGEEAGTLQTVHALHKAGYEAGVAAARTFDSEAGGDSMKGSRQRFWESLGGFFARRGWGRLEYRAAHPAIGIVSSPNWAEALASETDPEGSCSFSTGFLSGLLSQLVGGPVAVLEVRCRTRGDDACHFAFGSERAVHDLYGHLLDGAGLEDALQAL